MWIQNTRTRTSLAALVLAATLAAPGRAAGGEADLAAAIDRALSEASLDVVWQVGTPFAGVEAAWQAPNGEQGLRTFFLPAGVRVVPRQGRTDGWAFALELSALARGERTRPAPAAEIGVDGNRVEYRRGGLTEWYVNRAEGVEQGFTLGGDPLDGDSRTEPLELVFALAGDLVLEEVEAGTARLVRNGEPILAFEHLYAFDAHGAELACRFARRGENLAIVVDDRRAVYPVTIDPLIVSEEARLEVDLPPADDQFGTAVDISGSRAVVGAPSPTGVVYVFEKVDGRWELDAKLVPGDLDPGSRFGAAVAVFGARIAVGAPRDDAAAFRGGTVYTYDRFPGGTWFQQQQLVPSEPEFEAGFGTALDMAGTWLLVGAPREDALAQNSGVVYAFEHEGGDWQERQRLLPASGEVDELFGRALAMDGLQVAIGAPGQSGSSLGGSVHVFEFSSFVDRWLRGQVLTTDDTADLGAAVALHGSLLAAGAPKTDVAGTDRGAVVFFQESGGQWSALETCFGGSPGDQHGACVALGTDADGDVWAIVGSPRDDQAANDAGCAEVLLRSTSGFTPVSTLFGSSSSSGHFGSAAAFDGETALISALQNAVGPQRSGTVHAFEQLADRAWLGVQLLKGTSHDTGDQLGNAVALHGDLAVVGARGDDDAIARGGAAFVFERSPDGDWELTTRLTAGNDIQARAGFGAAVATDGEQIVVGADTEDAPLGDSGAAYVFRRNLVGGWSRTARLVPSDPASLASFGSAVDVAGDLIVVGAFQASGPSILSGAAYLYRRSLFGSWNQEQKISPAQGDHTLNFGRSVAADAGTVLVGVPRFESPGGSTGAVQVYRQVEGSWTLVDTLLPDPAGGGGLLGWSLDLSSARLVAGAPFSDGGAGSVYVYQRTGEDFLLEDILRTAGERVGLGVATDGDLVVASGKQLAAVFQKAGALWAETRLEPADSTLSDELQVDASGDAVLVGDHVSSSSAGDAWVFRPDPPDPIQPFGFGDGSTRPCPCGNDTPPGTDEGCANSTGVGARLRGSGSASLAADDMVFTADQIPPGRSTQLFIGENRLIGLPFGDGLRIATVPFIRIPIQQASNLGAVTWTGLHATGFWGPGDVRFFQAFYRDPGGPCGSGFNVTHAVQVVFAP